LERGFSCTYTYYHNPQPVRRKEFDLKVIYLVRGMQRVDVEEALNEHLIFFMALGFYVSVE
jgi:hypothetical protein